MRPSLAQNTVTPLGRVLVLGQGSVSTRVALDIKQLGMDVLTERELGDWLPPPQDGLGLDKIKTALKRFAFPGGYVHPAASPWAERPELSGIAQEMGLDLLAPSARVLSVFSNKLGFLIEADRLKIPNLALSFDPIYTQREAEEYLKESSHPFVLKSAWGGVGGLRIRVIRSVADLQDGSFDLWLDQLREACGEAIVFPERCLDSSRLLSLPFARFSDGRLHFFPIVDASLQHHHRKVMEFCPAEGTRPESLEKMREYGTKFLDHLGYVGVGALEFLVDDDRVYLIDGASRLTHGYHLWERVAGTSAVEWQLATYFDRVDLPKVEPAKKWTHALSLRVYAEDAVLDLPQPGWIREVSEETEWSTPFSTAELDLGYQKYEEIPLNCDGLVAQLCVGSVGRAQAVQYAQEVIEKIWISGSLRTNEAFLRDLLAHPRVREDMVHSRFVEEEFIPTVDPPDVHVRIALGVCRELISHQKNGEHWWYNGKRIDFVPPAPKWTYRMPLIDDANSTGALGTIDQHRVCAEPMGEGRWRVRVDGYFIDVRRSHPDQKPLLFAQLKGSVHSILVREGKEIAPHRPLVRIASLRILIPHAVPVPCRIVSWLVKADEIVRPGQALAEIELIKPSS